VVSSKLDPSELQPFQFNPDSHFSSTGYTICHQLSKRCHDLGYLPLSKTFVMTDNSFCQLVENTEGFISDVASSLDVSNNQVSRIFLRIEVFLFPNLECRVIFTK